MGKDVGADGRPAVEGDAPSGSDELEGGDIVIPGKDDRVLDEEGHEEVIGLDIEEVGELEIDGKVSPGKDIEDGELDVGGNVEPGIDGSEAIGADDKVEDPELGPGSGRDGWKFGKEDGDMAAGEDDRIGELEMGGNIDPGKDGWAPGEEFGTVPAAVDGELDELGAGKEGWTAGDDDGNAAIGVDDEVGEPESSDGSGDMATEVGDGDDGGEAGVIDVSSSGDGIVSSRRRASSKWRALRNESTIRTCRTAMLAG